MLTLPDGRQVRDYPRLRYGGAKLADPQDRDSDILHTALRSVLEAMTLWLAVVGILVVVLARRAAVSVGVQLSNILRGATALPWHVILFTAGLVLMLIMLAAQLAGDYHIFGTDKVGQDVFYQALKSVRTGLVIGTLTTLIMLPFAVLLGIMAGYFRVV